MNLGAGLARTLDIYNILNQDEAHRNAEWERAFFEAFQQARVSIDSQEPQQGPDGWPYLFVSTTVDAEEPVIRIVDWLAKKGIGLVVNAGKELPDYVFSYGMLWNQKEQGQFLTNASVRPPGQFEVKEGQKIIAGPPSKEYFPKYVRKIVGQFLIDQGVENPEVLMVSFDMNNYDLCFSLESFDNPPVSEHKGIVEALSWFFPQHYSIVLVSEKGLPKFAKLDFS